MALSKAEQEQFIVEQRRKSKILVITNHSYMLWQFRRELIAELHNDYEIVISTPFVGHENDFLSMGCRMIETNVERRGINPRTDLGLFATYYKMIKDEKPTIVITYSIKPNIYAGFACRLQNVPYCVNVQGLGTAFQKELLASVVSIMYRVSLKNAKTVFFENQNNVNVFVNRKIIPQDKPTLLPGAGVNLDYYSFVPCVEHDKIRFLYLGRIMKEKGIDELFYAVRKLYEKYGDKIQLDLVGFFEDEYKKTVDQLVADGIVLFHGFQEDPRPFYANSDCIVLPSYHEGMSNVLLEAAAIGRCIITSDIPGCREAVEDGVSGYLCEKKNAQDLYEKMELFVHLSFEERKCMGLAGRKRMELFFDKKKIVEKTILELFK